MNNSLKNRLLEFSARYNLFSNEDQILVAVSGGLDSMVLLHLLVTCQQYWKIDLGVAYFHHGLRGKAADADLAFVKKTAQTLQLPFYSDSGDTQKHAKAHQQSIEEAARNLRMAFLEKTAQTHHFNKIVTAHHLNDQAETVLMRVLGNVGLSGLAGIRLINGKFIRPLLFAAQTEIQDYAKKHQIEFREDETNTNTDFLRNKIRHQLLPLLKTEFGVTDLSRFFNLSMIVQEWLPHQEKAFNNCFLHAVKPIGQNKIQLDIDLYCQYFSGVQIKVLKTILAQLSMADASISFQHFNTFLAWVKTENQGKAFSFLAEIDAVKKKNQIIFQKNTRKTQKVKVCEKIYPENEFYNDQLNLKIKFEHVDRSAVAFNADQSIVFVDADRLIFPLKLRTWENGDRMSPLGMKHIKKVSDILTDEKKLLLLKKNMLVLENKNELVNIMGCRISENYKITDTTQLILKIEIERNGKTSQY